MYYPTYFGISSTHTNVLDFHFGVHFVRFVLDCAISTYTLRKLKEEEKEKHL